jgi:U3 small nucleolar RNA-associated protein 25
LYRNFYESDIIIASPLGLRLAIEKKGVCVCVFFFSLVVFWFGLILMIPEGVVDFLSSLELVVVDQIESFLMQNWDHARFVFERLNLIPSTFKTDIQRLRMTSIDGKSKNLRCDRIFFLDFFGFFLGFIYIGFGFWNLNLNSFCCVFRISI